MKQRRTYTSHRGRTVSANYALAFAVVTIFALGVLGLWLSFRQIGGGLPAHRPTGRAL